MKKLKVLILGVVLIGFIANLNGGSIIPPPPIKPGINQTAILLIPGWPAHDSEDDWAPLPDSLEKYLEGDLWNEKNIGDNRLFVYIDQFVDSKETYVTAGWKIGNDTDKWINRVRKIWNMRYNHINPETNEEYEVGEYDPNWNNLIATEYPEKIILITHSSGSLKARAYLTDKDNWRKDDSGDPVLDVSKIITANAIHTGCDFTLGGTK